MIPRPTFAGVAAAALLGLLLGPAARAQETSSQVEKCSRKLGVLAVAEPQTGWGHLSGYGLGSPAALLRMMVQTSGCFDVVERGVGMQNLQQERALAQGGDLRQDSNVGKGQMQAADFVMTPHVQIAAASTGGVGGALLGRLGPLGAIAGNLKFKEASTSLLVSDVRSSLQVAAAEGKATKTDFGIGGWGFGAGAFGALGGYASTPEGKMVAASFLDNYNKIVVAIRDQASLVKPTSTAGDANAAASTRAEVPQAAGQMLVAKIANVKAYDAPSRDAKVVATLQRTDELVATGEVKNGFVQVDAANFSGWVQRTLVAPAGSQAAPAPAPTPISHAPAAGIYGNFTGTFGGADQGSFAVTVDANGIVSGTGMSRATGQFGISGQVDAAGNLSLVTQGTAGGATFNGRINPNGNINGLWRFMNGANGGTFGGRRS